jgi:hypothetical protein
VVYTLKIKSTIPTPRKTLRPFIDLRIQERVEVSGSARSPSIPTNLRRAY